MNKVILPFYILKKLYMITQLDVYWISLLKLMSKCEYTIDSSLLWIKNNQAACEETRKFIIFPKVCFDYDYATDSEETRALFIYYTQQFRLLTPIYRISLNTLFLWNILFWFDILNTVVQEEMLCLLRSNFIQLEPQSLPQPIEGIPLYHTTLHLTVGTQSSWHHKKKHEDVFWSISTENVSKRNKNMTNLKRSQLHSCKCWRLSWYIYIHMYRYIFDSFFPWYYRRIMKYLSDSSNYNKNPSLNWLGRLPEPCSRYFVVVLFYILFKPCQCHILERNVQSYL